MDGNTHRVVVAIGSNGYIVTAHPLNLYDKVRPNRYRK
ncbi:hypothetical protein FHR81_000781 [Actinoalloteichus hoggarensis]|nr:hypothetical protein [Actinoalloteichus hoggarensis]